MNVIIHSRKKDNQTKEETNGEKENNSTNKKDNSENKTRIDTDIDINIKIIKETLKDCGDMVFREFNLGAIEERKVFLFYIDGMADRNLLNNFVMTPFMLTSRLVKPNYDEIKDSLFEITKNSAMAVTDFKEIEYIEDAINFVLTGETSILIDGYDKGFMVATKAWPARGIGEPSAETVIRGSRDGFVETFRFNTDLVRRRIRDPKFKILQRQIGERSKTDVAVMYIDDIVDKRVLEDLNKRLDEIEIDAIMDSGYVQQLIENRSLSPFPQTQVTERPDVVSAALYEGRVAVIVDNSPFALILPVTLTALFQSPEDYYSRSTISTFIRIVRLIAGVLSFLAPALYIAITSYDPGIIPSKLALSIAASREGVPFPAFAEALIMEFTFELLREAGVRLPRPIGSTIGIVGGVVIGQAAVSAGIVSPIMVIVVTMTAISSFAIPNYEVSTALRLIRFLMMIVAAIYGLYGVTLGVIALLIHLVSIKSFGTPFMSPLAPFEPEDIKDSPFVRLPWYYFKRRPRHLDPNDLVRQGGNNNDSK